VVKLLDGGGTWPSSGAGAVCRARDSEALWRGSEASIGHRVRAGLTVQGCARVFFCISIKALLGSYGRDDV
jgi:hypothetical protein